MGLPQEHELALLFDGNEEGMKRFLQEHEEVLKRYSIDDLLTDSDYTAQQKIQSLFSAVYGIVVDWREYDDEIVKLFGEQLLQEQVAVETTEQGLLVTYNGVQHPIALTFSPKDRYVTIRGFQRVIGDTYEIRLFEHSYWSDTHEFLVLPHAEWAKLEQRYRERIGEVFRVIDDELDFP